MLACLGLTACSSSTVPQVVAVHGQFCIACCDLCTTYAHSLVDTLSDKTGPRTWSYKGPYIPDPTGRNERRDSHVGWPV